MSFMTSNHMITVTPQENTVSRFQSRVPSTTAKAAQNRKVERRKPSDAIAVKKAAQQSTDPMGKRCSLFPASSLLVVGAVSALCHQSVVIKAAEEKNKAQSTTLSNYVVSRLPDNEVSCGR